MVDVCTSVGLPSRTAQGARPSFWHLLPGSLLVISVSHISCGAKASLGAFQLGLRFYGKLLGCSHHGRPTLVSLPGVLGDASQNRPPEAGGALRGGQGRLCRLWILGELPHTS